MHLTPLIEKAIRRAGELHADQFRKSSGNLPYLTHLFSVAALVSAYAPEEEVIAAALLHDTLEDTEYTGDELEAEFGPRVRNIVENVTEVAHAERDESSWRARKEAYLEKIRVAGADALIVSAADKVHNLQTMLDDFQKHGSSASKNFTTPLTERLWFVGEVLGILEERLDSPLVTHLRGLYQTALTTLHE